MSKLRIGLFGFGCVGQGLYETLAKNANIDAEIIRICVKNPDKQRSLPKEKFEYDPEAILNDDQINMVIELIDDSGFAFEIVKKSLIKGKHVVSANKKMIANHLEELLQLQTQYNTPLLYEGAVCGSIPIIRTLEDYYKSEKITEISGIFNGSTNYILSKVIGENQSYHQALEAAQLNGFAETDPTMDVGGFDPKFKLSILLHHAFGVSIHPDKIFNEGIENITKSDIHFARERKLKIKLISKATLVGDKIHAFIAPQFVSSKSPLFHVENEYNSVLINGEFSGDQSLVGKGAGKLPTGLAVLSDVAALSDGYRYGSKANDNNPVLDQPVVDAYISNYKGVLPVVEEAYEEIYEKGIGANQSYIIGKIGINKIEQLKTIHPDLSVIFGTGTKKEMQIPELTYRYA